MAWPALSWLQYNSIGSHTKEVECVITHAAAWCYDVQLCHAVSMLPATCLTPSSHLHNAYGKEETMQHATTRDGGQLYLFPTNIDLCMPPASLFQQAHTSIAACVRCALARSTSQHCDKVFLRQTCSRCKQQVCACLLSVDRSVLPLVIISQGTPCFDISPGGQNVH